MASLDEYIIPYLGLKNGEHKFLYKLDNEFFINFETSKIKEAQFDVEVIFDRRESIVTLDITCEGHYKAECDRCMVGIVIPLAFDDQVIIKLEESPEVVVDEIIYLDPKTSLIDISSPIYESVHVHLPIQNLKDCESEDYADCDPEMLDRLDGRNDKKSEVKGIWSELDKLNLN